jgi:hypothetical protein
MSTEERIAKIKEELALQSESYLKGVVDFVKWTSTVASAAMLWIGSNLTSMTGSLRIIVIIALACLASSLVTAICTVTYFQLNISSTLVLSPLACEVTRAAP